MLVSPAPIMLLPVPLLGVVRLMVAGYQQRRKMLLLPAAPFRFPLLVAFALVGFTVDKAVRCVGATDVSWLMPAVPVLDSV